MADHDSVQQAETAAAGKTSELTEAMIRTLLQHKQSPGDPKLFRSFYQLDSAKFLLKGQAAKGTCCWGSGSLILSASNLARSRVGLHFDKTLGCKC